MKHPGTGNRGKLLLPEALLSRKRTEPRTGMDLREALPDKS